MRLKGKMFYFSNKLTQTRINVFVRKNIEEQKMEMSKWLKKDEQDG